MPPDPAAIDTAPAAGGAGYDYLLVVGPGRSGSDFIYHCLKAHPQLAFPEIKEGYYYRSPKRFHRFAPAVSRRGQILADIANLAYLDGELAAGIARLQDGGTRVLLVVLLRRHIDRASSMLAFRRSRGEHSLFGGRQRLESDVARDSLTPERLAALYRMDTDVLTIHFDALVGNPVATLAGLSDLCGIADFTQFPSRAVNEAARARNILLARMGRAVARGMRRLGFRRTLQRIKDSRRVNQLFFVPRQPLGEPELRLTAVNREYLERIYGECCRLAAADAENLTQGVYLRRAAGAAAGDLPPSAQSI